MKRVLVTGGAGFVGANLVRRLLREGHEVHAALRRETDAWRLEGLDALRRHAAALEDAAAVGELVRTIRPQWVFHLAAHGGYSTQTDLSRMLGANVLGTTGLLVACAEAGAEAFVNTGSSSEYGFKDHAPAEDEASDPNSLYAATKAAGTLLCRALAHTRGLRAPTLRLYSVYGPYEEPTRLVPTLIRFGLRGELPDLVSPDVARDFVYVDDVVDAYLLAAAAPLEDRGAVFNVGSGAQTTIAEALEVARRELGVAAEPRWASMPDRGWDTSVWVADPRRIRRELGWSARVEFAEGFRRTVAWFRSHPQLHDLYARRPVPVT